MANVLSKSFISVTCTWYIFQFSFIKNIRTWTWKILDYLTGIGLTLWYVGLGLQKYLNCLTGLGIVLWYIGLGLTDNNSNNNNNIYLTLKIYNSVVNQKKY